MDTQNQAPCAVKVTPEFATLYTGADPKRSKTNAWGHVQMGEGYTPENSNFRKARDTLGIGFMTGDQGRIDRSGWSGLE